MSRFLSSDSQVSPDLARQLEKLRLNYLERLPEKIKALENVWKAVVTSRSESNSADFEEALSTAHRLFHSLAGSGATFGLPEVSRAARISEIVFKDALQKQRTLFEGDCQVVEQSLVDLQNLLSTPQNATESVLEIAPTPPVFAKENTAVARLIYVYSENKDSPQWLSSICTFGYDVSLFDDVRALEGACSSQVPAALILNCQSEPEKLVLERPDLEFLLDSVAHVADREVPLVWACEKSDLRPRLQGVRLGGSAFFTHPVDVDSLLVKLDELTNTHPPEPYRVLIVDDEPQLSALYSLIFRQAGMETFEVNDPFEVMTPLVEFRPDIILMDVHMPKCTGPELASVIRQQEAYVSIPIVFLSTEADVAKQMEAMRRGGDDFLLKPLQPRFLVSAVTTRVSRSRILRNLMMRDSLTGLLNHTKTKEQLAIEVDRVKRLGHSISIAMIDIDHFKHVNDSYGHATGDRVLRSLSRLLVQRLRQTDVIGRYGGEEFAVIMNGTPAEKAVKVLDEIRESFAQMAHYADGKEFKATFSAGIAEAPPHSEAENISESADKALYEAKRTGRNRIVLAK